MKIINRYVSQIFNQQKRNPNTVKYLMQQLPDSIRISPKELQTKKFKSPITAMLTSFIKETKKLSVEDFLIDSFDLSKKAYGINDYCAPPLYFLEDALWDAAYLPAKNVVAVVKSNFLKYNRDIMFAGMTHELKHVSQMYDGLRAESMFEKSVEKLTKISLNDDKNLMIECAKNLSFEQIDKLLKNGTFDEKIHNLYVMAKKSTSGDVDIKELTKEHTNVCKDSFINKWKQIQAKVIEELGTIKPNTKKSIKAEKLFNSIFETKEFGTEEYLNYAHEKDAYFVCKYLRDLYVAVKADNIKNFF